MIPKAAFRHTSGASGIVLLARHGETADNTAGKILGHRDPPLSEVGLEQARALAASVADARLVRVWCSPLQRARETARIVADATGIGVTVLPDLIESARGSWEGREVAALQREDPAAVQAFFDYAPDFAFPGGESLARQRGRTLAALEIVTACPLPALIVAHAGTIRAALAAVGLPVGPESSLARGNVCLELETG